MRLDERKRQILQAVIHDYVERAEPIGSRVLARRHGLGVSPATIRNEMADLEEMGLLEQPHTSAGRVPTDAGYRFYVDRLMEVCELAATERDLIRNLFRQRVREIEELIRLTVQLLSDTTDCLAMVSTPEWRDSVFRSLQLVPLGGDEPRRAALLIVTDDGLIEHRIIEVAEGVTEQELRRISQVLTERLAGLTVQQLTRGELADLQRELARYRQVLDRTLAVLHPHDGQGGDRLRYDGTVNILRQPEFQDVDGARALLNLLQREELVRDLLASSQDGIRITIGQEHPLAEMRQCSLVTATYRLGDRVVGQIGVLGPRRMDYGRVVTLVEQVTSRLTRALTNW